MFIDNKDVSLKSNRLKSSRITLTSSELIIALVEDVVPVVVKKERRESQPLQSGFRLPAPPFTIRLSLSPLLFFVVVVVFVSEVTPNSDVATVAYVAM